MKRKTERRAAEWRAGGGIGEGLIYSEVNEEKKKSRRVPRTETAKC